jgi:hypothetical protein
MKKRNKDLTNTSCTSKESKNSISNQIEQQMVQQRYFGELAKYQEQINRTKEIGSQDGQAA